MSQGLASFYKILKDETRQRIILLLNEQGSMSYTDLMERSEALSTGLFNYHLKVLNDLIKKNENGQYTLSDKGQLALRLLNAFPGENKSGRTPRWWRKFWIAHGVFDSVAFIVLIATYSLGLINSVAVYNGVLIIFTAIGIGYMITHITKDVVSKKGLKKINRATYLFAGAFVLGFVLWIGFMSFLRLGRTDSAIAMKYGNVTLDLVMIAGVVLCYLAGALFLDFIGKLIDYKLPRYP